MELVISLFTTLVSFILALFVFYKNWKSATNIYFLALIFFIGLYPIFNYLSLHAVNSEESFFWAKFVLFSAIPAGPLFYFFVKTFPNNKSLVDKKILFIVFVWWLVNTIFAFFGLIFSAVVVSNGQLQIQPGPAVLSFAFLQISSIFAGFWVLFQKYKKSTGFLKLQLSYITFGIVLSFSLTLFSTLIMPIFFSNTDLVPISPVFLLIAGVAIAYAIVRHKLFDIRLIVVRVVTYTLLIIILGAIYAAGIFAVGTFVTGVVRPAMELVVSTVVLALIMAFTFQPIRRFLEEITDTIFYKHHYSTSKLLHDLALIMASTIRLEDLMHKMLKELLSQMHVSRGAFVLLTEHGSVYEVAHEGYTFTPEFDEKDIKEIVDYHDMLILEELPEDNYKSILRKLEATVVVYLSTEGQNIGVLVLGEKMSGDIYTSEDIRVLKIFAPEAAIAIQNAQSFEEVRRFSLTLQEEVDKATKELLIANKKLEALDRLKDEFLSLASHELRTPMVAIKSYLWMVLEGRTGKVTEKQKEYLEVAYKSADRLIALVNDMLNISRIESGKLAPDLKSVKLNQLVDDVVVEMTPRATEMGVEISVTSSPTLPQVLADFNEIKEVLINLIGNSLKYTPKGGKITITLRQKDGFIETCVSDTGMGLKKEDLPKLFQKFGMVGGQRPVWNGEKVESTGLGLYLCKLIVELHGGRIWAESEGEGKGSAFTFSLKVVH